MVSGTTQTQSVSGLQGGIGDVGDAGRFSGSVTVLRKGLHHTFSYLSQQELFNNVWK